jgi:hypothetical protein
MIGDKNFYRISNGFMGSWGIVTGGNGEAFSRVIGIGTLPMVIRMQRAKALSIAYSCDIFTILLLKNRDSWIG